MLTTISAYVKLTKKGAQVDKEKLRFEIKRKRFMLYLTERLIKTPPDEISKTMSAQAEKIRDEIENMSKLLKQKPNKTNKLKKRSRK
jgi:hypothetical protein